MVVYPVPSTRSILVGGVPLFLEGIQGAETGGALILAGDLVQYTDPGNNDCTVKAGRTDNEYIIGVANIHPVGTATPPRGGNRVTAYAEGDTIEILRGPLTVMLRIAASQDIVCGEYVQPAASGEVKAYVCGTDHDCQRIAQALETTTVDTTTFQWAMFALERFG